MLIDWFRFEFSTQSIVSWIEWCAYSSDTRWVADDSKVSKKAPFPRSRLVHIQFEYTPVRGEWEHAKANNVSTIIEETVQQIQPDQISEKMNVTSQHTVQAVSKQTVNIAQDDILEITKMEK